uniref:Uncharacterized protein n=1 Tax=Sphaerodactylus townsendi TaxID=933632 RepID=A0ACB8ETD6_9SAUR
MPSLPLLLLALALAAPARAQEAPPDYPHTEDGAVLFAADYNSTAEGVFFHSVSASWTYNTNLTDFHAQQQVRPRATNQPIPRRARRSEGPPKKWAAFKAPPDFRPVLLR